MMKLSEIQIFRTVSLLLFFTLSCSDRNDEERSLIIEYETACGWCAGSTLLIIEDGVANYTRTIPCGINKGTTNKTLLLGKSELDNIFKSYSQQQFLNLTINECGVCFDGCDERVKIILSSSEHQIKYLPAHVPDEINSLRDQLTGIIEKIEKS
jgi:hypothetical protein